MGVFLRRAGDLILPSVCGHLADSVVQLFALQAPQPCLISIMIRLTPTLRAAGRFLLLLVATATLPSCGDHHPHPQSGNADRKVRIVTSTTMVTDLVQQLAGDAAEVEPLMGPGVDPHLYKPTAEDVKKLQRADAIIFSGLHLEGRMAETFKNMVSIGKEVLSIGEQLPRQELLRTTEEDVDPHIWGDAKLWSKAIPVVSNFLFKLMPAHKEQIDQHGLIYLRDLAAAHEWLRGRVNELPDTARVLVTSHDAFRYFGRAYGLEVISVQGISTDGEASLSDVARVVDQVKRRKVKALFVENSVPPAMIQRISKDSGAVIGGELLSDALSTPGDIEDVGGQSADRGTVIGMLKSNMHRITTALKP